MYICTPLLPVVKPCKRRHLLQCSGGQPRGAGIPSQMCASDLAGTGRARAICQEDRTGPEWAGVAGPLRKRSGHL